MKVGVTQVDPFVNLEGPEPAGVEVELIKEFALHLGVEVEWVERSESELVELLKGTEIDVMLAGLDRGSPFGREVALTRPYANVEIVVAAPPEDETPEIEGLDHLLNELGYRKTGHSLKESEHCFAVPFGENAWLVAARRAPASGGRGSKAFQVDDPILCVMRGGFTTVEQTLLAGGDDQLVRQVRLRCPGADLRYPPPAQVTPARGRRHAQPAGRGTAAALDLESDLLPQLRDLDWRFVAEQEGAAGVREPSLLAQAAEC